MHDQIFIWWEWLTGYFHHHEFQAIGPRRGSFD